MLPLQNSCNSKSRALQDFQSKMTLLPPPTTSNNSKRQFARAVACLSLMTGVVLSALGFVTSVFQELFILGGMLCIASTLGGLLVCPAAIEQLISTQGLMKRTPAIVWSYILTGSACFGSLVLGGICILFMKLAATEISILEEVQYVNRSSEAINLESVGCMSRSVTQLCRKHKRPKSS